jgi:REP element-mobilizing transposase RayT
MSQSLSQIWVHVIFSTKNRKSFLKDPGIRKLFHNHIASLCNQHGSPALIVGGVEDHVHLLINLNKNQSLSSIIENIKKYSSKWIKALAISDENLSQFYWQNGYGAFSVSQSNVEKVKNYIENQESHHRKISFQDELRKIFALYGVNYDERYVWG